MPRYFFHLEGVERSLADRDGMILSGPEAARGEAIRAAQDFFHPALGCVDPTWKGWSIDVRGERGDRIVLVSLAQAGEPQRTHAPQAGRPTSSVVYLDAVRVQRELSSIARRTRDLLRRSSALMDNSRYRSNELYYARQELRDSRLQAQKLLRRSQLQSSSRVCFSTPVENEILSPDRKEQSPAS
jgi:hypothetical protein